MMNRIQQLASLGQAIWLDNIGRRLIHQGELAALVDEGLRGVTSNPTIFHKAITGGSDYDADIRSLARQGLTAYQIYEQLTVGDVGAAADVMRRVYNETHGRDGYVSIEVNPESAHDTHATVEEARRLWAALHRPNIMIKVPATEPGLPAITALVAEGINVNVTLIFSLSMYERVIRAYIDGLRRYRLTGRPLGLVSSVASFFVSRVDTAIDTALEGRIRGGEDGLERLMGQAAVANAVMAYQHYKSIFEGAEFAELRAAGARPQRPLWASTGTKNPAYSPTKYVDPLIGVNTVNTVPPATLAAIRERAVVALTIEAQADHARRALRDLAAAGVDLDSVTDQLLVEGVAAFRDSFAALMRDIEAKRAAVGAAA